MKIKAIWVLTTSVITAGAPIWFLSYGAFVNTKIIWLSWGLILLLTLFFCLLTKEQNKNIFFMTALGFIIATIIKIIIDGISDPSSHNLLPFEIVYYAIIAFVASAIGVSIGFVVKKIFYRRQNEN